MPRKPCATPGCHRLVAVGDARCPEHARQDKIERDRVTDARRADRPSRKWYRRTAWCGPNGRRLRQLRKQPLCQMCPAHARRQATVADHVEPHREDHGRFWFGALQSLCAHCHNSKKQRLEKRGLGGGSKP